MLQARLTLSPANGGLYDTCLDWARRKNRFITETRPIFILFPTCVLFTRVQTWPRSPHHAGLDSPKSVPPGAEQSGRQVSGSTQAGLSGLRARGCSREGVGRCWRQTAGESLRRGSQLQDAGPSQPPALLALTYVSLKMSQRQRLSSAEPGGAGVQGPPRACPP